ncbi:unnamed protein product [Rotaria sp. Silwood2]|nr:unnamed protein product [Rotaria sp. Silwood2]CAF3215380.1 unnamed protein product [Rotaria sp. Silwood2]CAF3308049.1 unnamed protein product [Rotaria sp. Silwood2]CAF3315794.1 unnamed protein product [Rotaria sp. Silwood2]CAF4128778.1 unnamed protein product [Rotaria sp. Silwood2]
MSTEPTPSAPPPPPSVSQKIDFAPLHRTVELENIHAQVIENDIQPHQPQSHPTRKILVKHMTVIGDGSDMDNSQIITQQ